MPWLDRKISRGRFLKLVGSGIGVVVVGGAVWRSFSNGVFSSGQGPAYEPWKDWKTESEFNTDHFVIERSLDNLIFTERGAVTAAGNSTSRAARHRCRQALRSRR